MLRGALRGTGGHSGLRTVSPLTFSQFLPLSERISEDAAIDTGQTGSMEEVLAAVKGGDLAFGAVAASTVCDADAEPGGAGHLAGVIPRFSCRWDVGVL